MSYFKFIKKVITCHPWDIDLTEFDLYFGENKKQQAQSNNDSKISDKSETTSDFRFINEFIEFVRYLKKLDSEFSAYFNDFKVDYEEEMKEKIRAEALFYTDKNGFVGVGSLSNYKFIEDNIKSEGDSKQTDRIQVDTDFYVVPDISGIKLNDMDDNYFNSLFEDSEIP